ncbi:MAG TPA: MiaB/RimO family radical SAM methylthiotransferase [Candidatus Desulfaltia sp.]|nr:MiaB/RimO family radical SAM methylthiotransferase [Candidatus Desulfaltia sp.]
MLSCFIQNFGCRVNQAEAFSWAEELERGGMRLEDDPARADWVIVNTCTLTSKADRDVRKFIRRIPRINPGAKLVIAGCSVESGTLQSETLGPDVLLLSNADKKELPQRILSRAGSRAGAAETPFRSRALLKVQDGCDLQCAFCIIPSVRGPSRSLDRKEILAGARRLIVRGFREIVLCGIHLSSYGFDLRPQDSLAGLLGGLLELEGLGKLRLSSLDPRSLDEELIRLITGSSGVCPHFHLSLQHGSDRILKRMGRGSSSAGYRRILERLRDGSPAAALGADIIVGFPGEAEEDFESLQDFLAGSPLDYLHVFAYSPRPGTPAAGWPQVGEPEKRRRSAVLREFSAERRRAFRQRFLGQELEAIVVRKKGSGVELLTSNDIAVRVPRCSGRPGGEAKVRITRVEPEWTEGEEVA